MKNRSPIAVFFFSLFTIFIYTWYWSVKTKGEMNMLGEKIPTAFIWLIPIVGPIWWTWKYSEGVEHITHEKLSGVLAFIVLWLLGPIGNAIVQDHFNKISHALATTSGSPITPEQAATIAPIQSTLTPATSSNQPPTITPPSTPIIVG